MIPKRVHDPDRTIQEIEPLLRELDFAFKLAVPQAHSFFAVFHKKPINKPLLSNLIRYHALEYLWAHGHTEAIEEGVDGWGFRGLPNNGIELLYKRKCICIRKGIDPPYPMTGSAQDFYSQKLFEELESGIETNLLILYNLDAKLQYDGRLCVIRPVRLISRTKDVVWDWRRTVTPSDLDVSKPITPEYMHDSELPLDGSEGSDREKSTGTDGVGEK